METTVQNPNAEKDAIALGIMNAVKETGLSNRHPVTTKYWIAPQIRTKDGEVVDTRWSSEDVESFNTLAKYVASRGKLESATEVFFANEQFGRPGVYTIFSQKKADYSVYSKASALSLN